MINKYFVLYRNMNTKVIKDIIEIQFYIGILYAYHCWAKTLIKK